MLRRIFTLYFLPGLMFQSVVIAGGYATGRELVEFFLTMGPINGLLAMAVSTAVWSLVLALSFEFARVTRSYDYRTFFKHLLGKGWVIYEAAYLAMMMLVLAVIGNAAGEMIQAALGLPPLVGSLILMGLIGFLTFHGSDAIERVLAGWSLVLYLVYGVFLFWGLQRWGDSIVDNLVSTPVAEGWIINGLEFAGYNLAVVPTILFCIRHLTRRHEAIVAGFLGGLLAMLPGLLFYILLVGFYPDITQEAVPVNTILAALESPLFHLIFQVVIFGTFVETGAAMVHALNERLASGYARMGKQFPSPLRALSAVVILLFAVYVGQAIGLVALIANGYGALTYLILAVFVLPLLTIGCLSLWKTKHAYIER